jgi:hypothetical protein
MNHTPNPIKLSLPTVWRAHFSYQRGLRAILVRSYIPRQLRSAEHTIHMLLPKMVQPRRYNNTTPESDSNDCFARKVVRYGSLEGRIRGSVGRH